MAAPETQPSEQEFCTNCCDFVDELNDETGWCNQCSVTLGYIAPSCLLCGSPVKEGRICGKCKYEQWLERNADAIEFVMATEYCSVRVAKRIVRERNRPICQSCGNAIKGGQRGRHFFCTKNPECVKAHTAYSYHIRNKPQHEAVALAITASVIYKLTANIQ